MATLTDVKAPVTAAFTDGTVDVAPGDTLFLFTDEAAGILPHEHITLYYDVTGTPDLVAFTLTGQNKIQVCSGYAKLIGKKGATTVKLGFGKFSA